MINHINTSPAAVHYRNTKSENNKTVDATAAAIEKTTHVRERRQGDRRKNQNVKRLMDRRMSGDRRESQYSLQV